MRKSTVRRVLKIEMLCLRSVFDGTLGATDLFGGSGDGDNVGYDVHGTINDPFGIFPHDNEYHITVDEHGYDVGIGGTLPDPFGIFPDDTHYSIGIHDGGYDIGIGGPLPDPYGLFPHDTEYEINIGD